MGPSRVEPALIGPETLLVEKTTVSGDHLPVHRKRHAAGFACSPHPYRCFPMKLGRRPGKHAFLPLALPTRGVQANEGIHRCLKRWFRCCILEPQLAARGKLLTKPPHRFAQFVRQRTEKRTWFC